MDQQQLITPKEAAPLLKVSEKTLKRWRKAGKGPKAHRLEGRAIRYRLADIETWLEASSLSPAVEAPSHE